MSIIVLGVCLYCLNRTCSKCRFNRIISNYGLLFVGSDSLLSPGPPTQLGLVLFSRNDNFVGFGQLFTFFSLISNHDTVFASYARDLELSSAPPDLIRVYNCVDLVRLHEAVESEPFDDIFSIMDVDSMVERFAGLYCDLYDDFVALAH